MPRLSAIFAGLVFLAITLLALNVSRLRLAEKTKDKGSPALDRAIRLHLNNLEHGVPFVLMLVLLETLRLGSPSIIGMGIAFLGIRAVHGIGWVRRGAIGHRLHSAGATLTYALLVAMAITLIVVAASYRERAADIFL